MARGIKFKMVEILLCWLKHICKANVSISHFLLTSRRTYSVSINRKIFILHFIKLLRLLFLRLILVCLQNQALRHFLRLFLTYRLTYKHLGDSFAFPFHHLLEYFHFFFKEIFFSFKSYYLFIVELVSTKNLIV